MREFLHGQGARWQPALQSHFLPVHGRNAAAHWRVARARIRGGHGDGHSAPAEEGVSRAVVLSGEPERRLRFHEDDHTR